MANQDKDQILRSINENAQNLELIEDSHFDDITKERLKKFIYHKRMDY